MTTADGECDVRDQLMLPFIWSLHAASAHWKYSWDNGFLMLTDTLKSRDWQPLLIADVLTSLCITVETKVDSECAGVHG